MTGTRLRPFAGLSLGAEDLLADQAYHRDALRRHRLLHHGWGILEGLACEALPADDAVAVARGVAVTRRGDVVELPEGHVLSAGALGAAPGEGMRVVLSFTECPDPRSLVPPFGGGTPEASRIDEGARVRAVPLDAPREDDAVELCRVRFDAAGRIAGGEVDRTHADRWRAPVRAEAAPIKAGIHDLAEALRRLPGLLPPRGADGAWLAMGCAAVEVALMDPALPPEAAAALGARLLALAEPWLAREAPAPVSSALSERVRASLVAWGERDAAGIEPRVEWGRRVAVLARVVAEFGAEGVAASARPAFRELGRLPPAGTGEGR